MKATIKPAYVKERKILGEVLPLRNPWRITISASQLCNFKCFFCTHSLDHSEVKKTGFNYKLMSFDEFKLLANQLSEFSDPLKLVVFSGMGEPLLNNDLPKMIKYLRDNNIAERVEIYTNASLLTKEWTHSLVDAGLTSLKVSIEGLSSEKYKEVCNVNINFNDIVQNVGYFFDNKNNCKVYVKIIDSSLETGENEKFFRIFGDICDEIFIEHLSDCQPLTNDCKGKVNKLKTMYNDEAKISKVCPMLFYGLYADVDLDIYPCVTLGLPKSFSIGNCKNEKLVDMWNGKKISDLRICHLTGNKDSDPVCRNCGNMMCMYHKEDDIDSYSDIIFNKIMKQ